MQFRNVLIVSFLTASVFTAAQQPQPRTVWLCETISGPTKLSSAVNWRTLNCSSPGIPLFGKSGPVIVNVIDADLTSAEVRLAVATAPLGVLAPIDSIASSSGRKLLAGINGGYFWRVDVGTFVDTVCIGKSRADATSPVGSNPNFGLGDGSTVSNGSLLASNCNCTGFNRPAVVTINGSSTRIDVLTKGAAPPAGLALDSLSAGPYLLTTNASGTYEDIPKDDQNVGNILEHSANTALGLASNGTAYLITFDGHDGCKLLDPTCGNNAFDLAYFARDYLNCTSAMGMDQGGSTTMWISGQPNDGIVSNPGSSARPVFNGLFLEQTGP